MPKRANIMVSYKTENRKTADEIAAALDAAGLGAWVDHKRIKPGKKWRDELLLELRSCDAFVALLTREYVESEHCRMELFIARSRGCPVLPVALDDCFDLLDRYEETKGLADTFMVRLYRLSLVGLTIDRDEALRRVVHAAQAASSRKEPANMMVYVSYCNDEAPMATHLARVLERDGVPAWVATQDCRVGENWRLAQARGLQNAALQVVVMDESIATAEVLRTEILLAEAFGLPVLTVLGVRLSEDQSAVTRTIGSLQKGDLTYRRLADVQAYRSDAASLDVLSRHIRRKLHMAAPGRKAGAR